MHNANFELKDDCKTWQRGPAGNADLPGHGAFSQCTLPRYKFFPFPACNAQGFLAYYAPFPPLGDIAQLVERLNGIEKVRGSTPLISTIRKVRFAQ